MQFNNNPNYSYQYYNQQPMQDYFVSSNGFESVINYPLAPNCRVWFIDETNKKVYRKVRDNQGGVPFIDKEFDLIEVVKSNEATVQYDEGELNKLRAEVNQLTKELASIKSV